jgi:DNA polymerase III psi subunit
MSAQAAHPAHRTRVLRALGVVPWRLRAVAANPESVAPAAAIEMPAHADVVVVLPPGCSVRELDLIGRALCAFGPYLARAARVEATDSDTLKVPQAKAYLVFGQAQAHTLGRVLPAQVMRDAHIVLADAPADVMGQAAAKRRLWQALRSMRRALATGAPA